MRLLMDLTTISLTDILVLITLIPTGFMLAVSVDLQIRLYQGMSGLLAVLTIWTAVTNQSVPAALLAMVPVGMAIFVSPILKYIAGKTSVTTIMIPDVVTYTTVRQRILCFGVGWGLVVLTFWAIFTLLTGVNNVDTLRLCTSLTMVLVGVFSWIVRKDLLSQAIGLLVMDHGLFLMAESIILRVSTSFALIISLFIYLSVPLTCLLFVMPRLRQMPGGLQVDKHRKLRG
jgi:hydrogenase-4 membrane subunit HyfE